MKIIFILLVMCSFYSSKAQQYALIDRGWERPIRFVDSVNKTDLKAGWYPVLHSDMDSLLSVVDKFRNIHQSGLKRSNYDMTDISIPSIDFEISNVTFAYGDRYDINMISKAGESKVSMKLSNAMISNRENQQLIKKFYHYLKKYQKQTI